jgi:UDP-N-acetylmuramyl-tripeptide synthetase
MHRLHTPLEAAHWLAQHVTGALCSDSRKLAAGDGFIAWPGVAVDPRQFVDGALGRGAAACLVEHQGLSQFPFTDQRVASYLGLKQDSGTIAAEFCGTPSKELAVIAVTGTNGKTSSTWWLAQALSILSKEHALPCAVVGTLGVGQPPATATASEHDYLADMTSTGMTTPDPILLQHTLRNFATQGLRACAIEASSIGLQEGRLDGVLVRVAVFTNLTQDHLDYHGSMDAYWQAKRKLFSWPGLVSAVINIDDDLGAELAESLASTHLDVWTLSQQSRARLQARNVQYDAQGLCFEVVEGNTSHALRTRMMGSFNVSNLLGVIAAMRALGVPLQDAVEACSALHPVPGRMQCLGEENGPLVAVDYAHTPDALSQALTALRPLALQRGGRLWCVFGCGGDRDASKRPLMGAIAVQKADQVVVTSDNPRSERPGAIIAQILLGMVQSENCDVQTDRALAIAETIDSADSCDVILLAGKGHEDTQDIAGVKHHFSDRVHAAKALAARKQSTSKGVA